MLQSIRQSTYGPQVEGILMLGEMVDARPLIMIQRSILHW
jgi:hypothetical protein